MADHSVMHKLVHDKILECHEPKGLYSKSFLVSSRKVRILLGHRYHIKSRVQWKFIREMEVAGLLQVKSYQTIKIFK